MGRRRVDLQTAAQLLGISSDAVRKRAKRGNMDYETGADGKLYVWVDTGQTTDYPTSTVGPGGLHGDVSHAGGDRHDPREELIATLREQLEAEREANREMRRLLAGLIERVPQLEAPAESPTEPREPSESAGEASDTAEPRSSTEEQQEEPTSRPWWRRMFGT
jgi:hypothetical protein